MLKRLIFSIFNLVLLTRSVLRAFENFPNAREVATAFLNVVVADKICPELEARLDLMQPPKKPKRRFSQCSSTPYAEPRMKKRRFSVAFEQSQHDSHGPRTVLEESNTPLPSPSPSPTRLSQETVSNPLKDSGSIESRFLFGKLHI